MEKLQKKNSKRKNNKIKPCKRNQIEMVNILRYLPGQIDSKSIQKDLRLYNLHREKVINAQPCVDDKPPKLNLSAMLNPASLMVDAKRMSDIQKQNQALVKSINVINRTSGKIDSFNPKAYERSSKWETHEMEMKKIEKHNLFFYKRLQNVKAVYQYEEHKQFWENTLREIKRKARYPLTFEEKTYDQVLNESVSISKGLSDICVVKKRPRVYLDLQIENGQQHLGKIIIELYIDYVPLTVNNFMSLCTGKDGLSYKNCVFYKIYPYKWCESGDIVQNNGSSGKSIYGDNFEEENYELKHTRQGVLSMITTGEKENDSRFTISFKELPQCDEKRVVFGKIVKGNKIIDIMNSLGRKNGCPVEKVVIIDCGICEVNKIVNIKRRKIR